MSPEDYAALLASGKVALSRDPEGNYLFNAKKTTAGVLPRDIIEQMEKTKAEAIAAHELRMQQFTRFITDLTNAN